MATSRPQSPRSHRRRVPTRDPAATAGEKKNRRGRRAAHLLRFKRSSRAGDASPCRPHTGLARSTSGSPLDPAPFRQDEPRGGATAPQGKTPTLLSRQGLEPVASAAKALSPTEPGGETQVEATCVNARRKVGTDPGSIPGASKTPKSHVFGTLQYTRTSGRIPAPGPPQRELPGPISGAASAAGPTRQRLSGVFCGTSAIGHSVR